MKKTLIILGLGVFLYSCNETTEATENETTESQEVESNMEDEVAVEEETEMNEPVVLVDLEDRNYKVEEFVTIYGENKEGLVEQTITIEGYYMNYNKQKDANSDDEFEYNVTLYSDKSFDRDAPQVFFKMKSKDGDQFKGIKQKDKIIVTGVITGDEFFDAPLLEEAVVIKE